MADSVELTDLEVIRRYSLAVRAGSAERSELLAALRSDLAWLEGGRRAAAREARPTPSPGRPTPGRPSPGRKAPRKATSRTASA